MNNKSKLSTAQTVIVVATALYVALPDVFIGPIDDTVIALIAGITELILGFVKSRINESSTIEWEEK